MTEGMAQRIKELRKEKGLTLEQVADIVGVGKSTVRKWETGMIANMKRDKISNLAKALDTTPAYLMGWSENESQEQPSPDKQELTEGERKWLELYHQISDDAKKLLIEMANSFEKMSPDTQRFLLGAIRAEINDQK